MLARPSAPWTLLQTEPVLRSVSAACLMGVLLLSVVALFREKSYLIQAPFVVGTIGCGAIFDAVHEGNERLCGPPSSFC